MEERLRQLEAQLEEKNQELLRVRKRGKSAVAVLLWKHSFLMCCCFSDDLGTAAREDERGAQQAFV